VVYPRIPHGGPPPGCHTKRCRVGPTSRKKSFMILVDSCHACGFLFPVTRDHDGNPYQFLTYQQARWIERSNRRACDPFLVPKKQESFYSPPM